MAKEARHLSDHQDRTRAAAIASGLLTSGRDLDKVTRQALEQVMFQRDVRLDVLAWTQAIATREVDHA